jgi:hypothetical protein
VIILRGDNYSPRVEKIILSDGSVVNLADIYYSLISGINNGTKYLSMFDYVSKHNESGKVFGMHIRNTIGASGTVQFVMKIPEINIKRIEALPTIITTDKPLEIDFKANVTVTNLGTNLKDSYIISMNQYLNYPSVIEALSADATITPDTGYNTFRDYIPANKYSSGQSLQQIHWICQPNCYYSATLKNLDNAECKYNLILYWIEHDL